MPAQQTARINRSSRGTIEFVINESGLKLLPLYKGGVLTGLLLNDGTRLMPGSDDGPWSIVNECEANKSPLAIRSVSVDESGNLTIRTKRN